MIENFSSLTANRLPKEPFNKAGVRAAANCHSAQREWPPPRTSSVRQLRITLLPKLDRNVHPMLQRGRSALLLRRFALEVHRNNGHCCITDVRICLIWLRHPPFAHESKQGSEDSMAWDPGSKSRLACANDFNVGHLTTSAGDFANKIAHRQERNCRTSGLAGFSAAGDGWQHGFPWEHQSSRSFQSMFLALSNLVVGLDNG